MTPQSGAQDGCFDEKTEGRKSRDTVPLTRRRIEEMPPFRRKIKKVNIVLIANIL
jgi:hypothetical protein